MVIAIAIAIVCLSMTDINFAQISAFFFKQSSLSALPSLLIPGPELEGFPLFGPMTLFRTAILS